MKPRNLHTTFSIGDSEEREGDDEQYDLQSPLSSISSLSNLNDTGKHVQILLERLEPAKHKYNDIDGVYTRTFNVDSTSSSFIFPVQESMSPSLSRAQSCLSIQDQIAKLEEKPKKLYSIYSRHEKYFIVILGAFCGFWSSISSPIYLPCLPILEKDFNVSEGQMNITVVVYSIFQGFAPIFFSNLADRFGRRLIIMICLLVYIAANVALAEISSFTALIVLRCLQAFGIASTISIASGVVTDVTQRFERGSFMGLSTGFSLLGQLFGALLGGLLESGLGWRSIFWFLTIAGGSTFILILFCLPETSRSLVGNGSSLPMSRIGRAPILYLKRFKERITEDATTNDSIDEHLPLDLLVPFKILSHKEVFLTLIPSSINYALWLMMLTTLSTVLSKNYGYSTLDVGLLYLPSGVGGFFGSFTSGQFLTWFYQKQYKLHLDKVDAYEHALNKYNKKAPILNIFKTRLSVLVLPTCLSTFGALLFGWSINSQLNVSAVIISSFLISYSAMFYMTVSSTLLVDIFPGQSSASTSCVNLTRCWTAALFIAVLSRMVSKMTVGGCYTLMASLCLVTSFCVYIVVRKGEQWFEERQIQELDDLEEN